MMRTAEWINLTYFAFFVAIAWIIALPRRRRIEATAFGAAGIGLILAIGLLRGSVPEGTLSIFRDWAPAPLILVAYWQAGRFARAPNERLQAWLGSFDRRVFGRLPGLKTGHKWRAWPASYFELAYLSCYPLVPIGLGVLYIIGRSAFADSYWAAVLPATYLCYATTAFFPTLPPRTLNRPDAGETDPGRIRSLNLHLIRHGSIQVNTFPSAHVAATMGCSLALLALAPAAGWVFLMVSASIAIGAVAGRYHYLADVLAGAALAAAFCALPDFVS